MKRGRKFSLPRCNRIGPEPPFAVTFTSSGSERSTSSRLREYCVFAGVRHSPPSSSRINRMKGLHARRTGGKRLTLIHSQNHRKRVIALHARRNLHQHALGIDQLDAIANAR